MVGRCSKRRIRKRSTISATSSDGPSATSTGMQVHSRASSNRSNSVETCVLDSDRIDSGNGSGTMVGAVASTISVHVNTPVSLPTDTNPLSPLGGHDDNSNFDPTILSPLGDHPNFEEFAAMFEFQEHDPTNHRTITTATTNVNHDGSMDIDSHNDMPAQTHIRSGEQTEPLLMGTSLGSSSSSSNLERHMVLSGGSCPPMSGLEQLYMALGVPGEAPHAVRTCFAKIALLESQLAQGKRPVDELMQAGKICAQQLQAVIKHETYSQCFACPMLIVTAVDLMTVLYETIFAQLSNSGSSSTEGPGAALPGQETSNVAAGDTLLMYSTSPSTGLIQLGCFQPDPEDAARVWRHLILGELARLLQLVDSVAIPPRPHQGRGSNAPKNGGQAAGSGNGPVVPTSEANRSRAIATHRSLCDSLRQRINLLTTALQERF
ncbi:hypothetical protein QBC35DRAFT_49078 [Podospora australis]|uniref:Aflatoxin regulatory protein domain-containing protein n=1 Tax=Podospora australis TaxID=1536484 RepID=A0AAN6WLU8_9PEZI|nr:hypothetical protein QBC35DRAFT_49078 [Podospora australis]